MVDSNLFKIHKMIGNCGLVDWIPKLLSAWYYLSNFVQMYQMKAKHDILMFTYESVVDNTDYTMTKLFEACGIDKEFVALSKTVMKHDSQDNIISLKGKGENLVMPYEGEH